MMYVIAFVVGLVTGMLVSCLIQIERGDDDHDAEY